MWFIRKDGKRVGKEYLTKQQAITEAFEKGLVVTIKGRTELVDGVEIVQELKEEGDDSGSILRQV